MRLPGGRQAQVVRAHDRGRAGAQALFQAEWSSRVRLTPVGPSRQPEAGRAGDDDEGAGDPRVTYPATTIATARAKMTAPNARCMSERRVAVPTPTLPPLGSSRTFA